MWIVADAVGFCLTHLTSSEGIEPSFSEPTLALSIGTPRPGFVKSGDPTCIRLRIIFTTETGRFDMVRRTIVVSERRRRLAGETLAAWVGAWTDHLAHIQLALIGVVVGNAVRCAVGAVSRTTPREVRHDHTVWMRRCIRKERRFCLDCDLASLSCVSLVADTSTGAHARAEHIGSACE